MNTTDVYWDKEDAPSVHPVVLRLRTLLILIISFLIIASNIINLLVLRTTVQIPSISRYCLINLSSADFLVGCVSCAPCVVTSALDRWIYGAVWCQIAAIIHGCSVTVSIWSLALISVDRYFAIVHPLRYHSLMTSLRCRIVIASFWTVSMMTFVFPLTLKRSFVYYRYSLVESICGLYWEYGWFCVLTAIYIPILSGTILAVTNFQIVRTVLAMNKHNSGHVTSDGQSIRPSGANGATSDVRATYNDLVSDGQTAEVSVVVDATPVGDAQNDGKRTRKKTNKSRDVKAVKVLGVTAVTYFLAWGPYVSSVVITSFFPGIPLPDWFRFTVMWIANSNSFMNVIIYSVMYSSFRKNVCNLIRTCFTCRFWSRTGSRVHPAN
ncbi:hypothetical protein LSH36_221g01016 [Paralvinella palmiformis]|uniref:G-protein coupled receptors family 1 profile domain-containing protein n=1 Tax=Paralvinella palmiformis TaxID=53620 RepID=A0AAD9N5F1_9ANNE|nr:hypothetical protein LSH36_221g01016 [Paralvinella palmiformis]